MKYSYEFKKKVVELYLQQGKIVDTPYGIQKDNFRRMVRVGLELLNHVD